jgi:hypothetical protein
VVPFLAAMLGVAFAPTVAQQDLALRVAVAYGAVILTFVGAVHFGLGIAGRWRWSVPAAVGATAPSVVGAIAVLLGGQRGLALVIVGLGMFWLYESRRYGSILPADYLSLRRTLSLVVCAVLAITLFLSDEAGLR